jgi:dTMP kinase
LRGKFITFEGGEGVGKSTQIKRLAAKLEHVTGERPHITREPGGSPKAEAIREVLLSGDAEAYGPFAEAVLFNTARHDHVTDVIEPRLANGQHVLCDRFMDSTRVYQGVSGEVEDDVVLAMEALAVGDTRPDITLVLDIDAKTAMERAASRRQPGSKPDRFEKEEMRLQDLRRAGFRKLASDEPERCVLIDASGDINEISGAIWNAVRTKLFPDLAPDADSSDLEMLEAAAAFIGGAANAGSKS